MTNRLGRTSSRRPTFFTRFRVAALAALGVVAVTSSVALADSEDGSEHRQPTKQSSEHRSGGEGREHDDHGTSRPKKTTPGKPAPPAKPPANLPPTSSPAPTASGPTAPVTTPTPTVTSTAS
jgi:type IV secretory pathway VirB10-like protein